MEMETLPVLLGFVFKKRYLLALPYRYKIVWVHKRYAVSETLWSLTGQEESDYPKRLQVVLVPQVKDPHNGIRLRQLQRVVCVLQ